MAVTRFYKFVRRFDQDVQRFWGGFSKPVHVYTRTHTVVVRPAKTVYTRLQDGFLTPWHVCATFGNSCNPVVYVFLYMLPISMFSQKYNI